jgi:hypothetical protein
VIGARRQHRGRRVCQRQIGRHGGDRHAGFIGKLTRSLLQRFRRARYQHEVHAFAGQRLRGGKAQPLAATADQRPAP